MNTDPRKMDLLRATADLGREAYAAFVAELSDDIDCEKRFFVRAALVCGDLAPEACSERAIRAENYFLKATSEERIDYAMALVASEAATLDDACAIAQTYLGVTSGDVASVQFSATQDAEWETTRIDRRDELMHAYIRVERTYAVEAPKTKEMDDARLLEEHRRLRTTLELSRNLMANFEFAKARSLMDATLSTTAKL